MSVPSLPALTWKSSTASTLIAPSGQDILDDLEALVLAESTYWEKEGSAAGYFSIKPKTGGNVDHCRIIFSINNTTGMFLDANPGANTVVMGLAPIGGLGTFTAYDSSDPYGNGKFSGYCRVTDNGIETLWFVESEEVFYLVTCDTGGNSEMQGGLAGAWLRGFDTGGTEADGRLWGMAVSGAANILATFWASATDWMGNHSTASQKHAGFFDPNDSDTFKEIDRLQLVTITASSGGYLTDGGGASCGLPFHYRRHTDPFTFVGAARQMCMTEDRMGVTEYQVGGVTKRISVAASKPGSLATDALGFFN